MKKKKTNNVEKLVDAGLVAVADLTSEDQALINDLSDDEIDAIVSAGTKVVKAAKPGDKMFKVIF